VLERVNLLYLAIAPGAKLPSDAQCAAWVRAKPLPENKGVNKAANHRTGQHVDGSLFSGDSSGAASKVDMSAAAVTARLRQQSALRTACLRWELLGRKPQ